MADFLIASIPKNSREKLQIGLTEYGGHQLLNLRVWYSADDGSLRPGKAGLALRIEKIRELIDALKATEMEANRLGLLS